MNTCFTLKSEHGPCLIILGRYGDVIQLCAAFKAIHERTGLKPIVMVSTDYASVLDGVSYVEPFPVHWPWYDGIPAARQLAQEQFGGGIVVQWWHDTPDRIASIEAVAEGGLVLQCHGREWGVDINRWPNYGTSMFDRAGFSAEEMRSLPLVFDRRDAQREERLLAIYRKRDKPMLLVNFTGHSSPFGPVPEVLRVINQYSNTFNIVDLGKIRATRVYDLLGLMDNAVGLITTDTSTLHLAHGSRVPYIAYTVNGWCTSVPKGNVQLEIKYNDAMNRLGDLVPVLERWRNEDRPALASGPGGGGAVMAV